MQEKEDTEITFIKRIETETKNLWSSMNRFNNLWNKIYEDCKENNTIELFEKWDSLHIAIYMSWKEISDTCQKFQQSLKIILTELQISKVVETFDINIIEEIAQEVKKFSKANEGLMEDKHCIESLTTKYFDTVNKELENLNWKKMTRTPKPKNSELLLTLGRVFIGYYPMVAYTEDETGMKKIDKKVNENGLSKLAQDLSKLPGVSIPMNVTFKQLGDLINEAIQSISVGSINTEIQIESLIKITQELQKIFDKTYHRASEYEGITRKLVMKSNPRFLIDHY